jgi:hypothetical protein
MKIGWTDDFENVFHSIRSKNEFDFNEIHENDSQIEKQFK